MATTFDISPEKRASFRHYLYRQLFVTPPPVLQRDVNLSGKTAIITGANGGIGLEVARQLLDLGCKVILTVRDEKRGETARQELINGRSLAPEFVQVWKLDLSSYESIIAFAERAKTLKSLDIAILSAGIFKVTESFSSSTGYEEGVQINFLANMLLTVLLLPIIKEKRTPGQPGHICVVSSDTAAWTKFEEGSSTPVLPAFKRKSPNWDMSDRYGATKLLGQLFLTELAKHVSSSVVTLSFANPGFCSGSELARETSGIIRVAYKIQSYILSRKSFVGARTLVHAVTTLGEKAHGQYVEDAKVQPTAVLMYKPEGLRLSKQVYEETLDELSFAGVRDIIDQVSKVR
ncbi:NAD(P)-binding protein [Daldinia caldariorum]|uniref:NAD(P)-binding protein n=1 Tax=Daldinia caldariorum TaxID=326644 RepID=UPI002007AAA8|nr:NAD(P)-binding protein [Daldinia caldariorum]KAI1470389.1 NAD(P)-binding protein [Daldinia caldariorum]